MKSYIARRNILGLALFSSVSSAFSQSNETIAPWGVQQFRDAYLSLRPNHTFAEIPTDVLGYARALLKERGADVEHETLMIVDRAESIQHAWIVLVENNIWHVIADGPISTGQTKRKGYFYTPIGVFEHSADILGYRAQGTKNSNGVRGLGIKGMRIWDFGWTPSYTGWLKNNEIRNIRFQIHATDPDLLEPRLGRPASKGCIRVSTSMNVFLDRYSILDKNVRQSGNPRALSTLHSKRVEHGRYGRFLVVVDSSPS